MLKVHETYGADGVHVEVHVRLGEDGLEVVDDEGVFPLPPGTLERVMARYGSALDATATLVDVASLDLRDGRVLRHVRHLARFDVIARDYLLLESPGEETMCALATAVAGALGHLGRRAAEC